MLGFVQGFSLKVPKAKGGGGRGGGGMDLGTSNENPPLKIVVLDFLEFLGINVCAQGFSLKVSKAKGCVCVCVWIWALLMRILE